MNREKPVVEVEAQACGCRTTTTEVSVNYEPCLACALKNAGIMLQQAGLRLDEAAEQARLEQAERAEAVRVQAEDFVGGSD